MEKEVTGEILPLQQFFCVKAKFPFFLFFFPLNKGGNVGVGVKGRLFWPLTSPAPVGVLGWLLSLFSEWFYVVFFRTESRNTPEPGCLVPHSNLPAVC